MTHGEGVVLGTCTPTFATCVNATADGRPHLGAAMWSPSML